MYFRNRIYDVDSMRWMQEDSNPAGQYKDGMGLYQFVRSSPLAAVDPEGLTRHVFAFEGLGGYHTDQLMDYLKTGSKEHLHGTFLRSFPFVLHDWIAGVIAPIANQFMSQTKWHYYAQNMVGQAVKEAVKIAKEQRPHWEIFTESVGACWNTIIVLGFSNGGRAAVEFAERLRDQKIRVDLGYTADPIPKGFEIPFSALGINAPFLTKPSNVSTWINFYQTWDTFLKGNPVAGARNAEVRRSAFQHPLQAHSEITGLPVVKSQLRAAVSSVPTGCFSYKAR